MLRCEPELRNAIRREARKQGISMNDYICTVMSQFIEIQKRKTNGDHKQENTQEV